MEWGGILAGVLYSGRAGRASAPSAPDTADAIAYDEALRLRLAAPAWHTLDAAEATVEASRRGTSALPAWRRGALALARLQIDALGASLEETRASSAEGGVVLLATATRALNAMSAVDRATLLASMALPIRHGANGEVVRMLRRRRPTTLLEIRCTRRREDDAAATVAAGLPREVQKIIAKLELRRAEHTAKLVNHIAAQAARFERDEAFRRDTLTRHSTKAAWLRKLRTTNEQRAQSQLEHTAQSYLSSEKIMKVLTPLLGDRELYLMHGGLRRIVAARGVVWGAAVARAEQRERARVSPRTTLRASDAAELRELLRDNARRAWALQLRRAHSRALELGTPSPDGCAAVITAAHVAKLSKLISLFESPWCEAFCAASPSAAAVAAAAAATARDVDAWCDEDASALGAARTKARKKSARKCAKRSQQKQRAREAKAAAAAITQRIRLFRDGDVAPGTASASASAASSVTAATAAAAAAAVWSDRSRTLSRVSALGPRPAAGGATAGSKKKLSSAAPAWSPPAPTVRRLHHHVGVRMQAPPDAKPGSYFSFEPDHPMHPMHGAFAELFRRPQPPMLPAVVPAAAGPALAPAAVAIQDIGHIIY